MALTEVVRMNAVGAPRSMKVKALPSLLAADSGRPCVIIPSARKKIHSSDHSSSVCHSRLGIRELLAQPIPATPARNGLLLRLFFGRTLGVGACRALATEAKAEAQQPAQR